jgi:hypothetical protein
MIDIEVGSTNVYADLGYSDPVTMQKKSDLAAKISRLTKDPVNLIGVDQEQISKITRGHFRGLTEAQLNTLVQALELSQFSSERLQT